MDNQITIYVDWASQPSRAVAAFCKMANIPHQLKLVRVGKLQHREEEYIKINPNMVVPAMTEINAKTGEQWNLFESHTILRYLA